jgi:hypothetical protein
MRGLDGLLVFERTLATLHELESGNELLYLMNARLLKVRDGRPADRRRRAALPRPVADVKATTLKIGYAAGAVLRRLLMHVGLAPSSWHRAMPQDVPQIVDSAQLPPSRAQRRQAKLTLAERDTQCRWLLARARR